MINHPTTVVVKPSEVVVPVNVHQPNITVVAQSGKDGVRGDRGRDGIDGKDSGAVLSRDGEDGEDAQQLIGLSLAPFDPNASTPRLQSLVMTFDEPQEDVMVMPILRGDTGPAGRDGTSSVQTFAQDGEPGEDGMSMAGMTLSSPTTLQQQQSVLQGIDGNDGEDCVCSAGMMLSQPPDLVTLILHQPLTLVVDGNDGEDAIASTGMVLSQVASSSSSQSLLFSRVGFDEDNDDGYTIPIVPPSKGNGGNSSLLLQTGTISINVPSSPTASVSTAGPWLRVLSLGVATTLTMTILWNDENNTPQSVLLAPQGVTSTVLNAVQFYLFPVVSLTAQAGSNITFTVTKVGVNAVSFDFGAQSTFNQ